MSIGTCYNVPMGINRVRSITNTCEKCGKEFHPWRTDRPTRFCSRECAGKGQKSKYPEIPCETCGRVFRTKGQGLKFKRRFQKFCSRECYQKAERTITLDGYVLVYAPDEPGAYKSGQIREHRLIMQRILGRPLAPGETIHHINGIRDDNRPENLQLRSGNHGKGKVAVCLDCGSHNIGHEEIADG